MIRRTLSVLLCALAVSLPVLAEQQREATVLRDTTLRAEPFSDAAEVTTLKARSKLTVLQRKGGWYQIRDGRQHSGWLRMSRIRFGEAGASSDNGSSGVGQTMRFLTTGRSGASGTTVATGIRGLDAADVANAAPDHQAVERLNRYRVDPSEAKLAAQRAGLHSRKVSYLKEPQ
ncbi:MAG: SH3 domain-containing protein [Pseudomonadota bacterium]